MRRCLSRAAIPALVFPVVLALLLGACSQAGVSVTTTWHAATGDPSSHWAPMVRDGVLYTEGGSAQPYTGEIVNASVIALRLTDGHMLWQTPIQVGDFGLAVDGSLLLVAAGKNGLYALDASDGAILWHQPVQLQGDVHAAGGIVVVTRTDFVAPDTYVESACLAAFRERDGVPLWCSPKWPNSAVAVTPTAVIINEGGNLVGALAPSTGEFLWEGAAQGSIVAVSDRQMLVSGIQQVAALDTATGHMVWQSTTPFTYWAGAAWSEPAAAVYGADQDEVVALRTSDGTQLWHARYGDYMAMQFVVEGGVLFVLLERTEGSPLVRLVAVAADSGAVYWQRGLPDNVLFLADIAATV